MKLEKLKILDGVVAESDDLEAEIYDPEKMCQEQMDYERLPGWLRKRGDDPDRNIEEIERLVGSHLFMHLQALSLLAREMTEERLLQENKQWELAADNREKGLRKHNTEKKIAASQVADKVRKQDAALRAKGWKTKDIIDKIEQITGIKKSRYYEIICK